LPLLVSDLRTSLPDECLKLVLPPISLYELTILNVLFATVVD